MITKFASSMWGALKLNTATMSGCSDVIVVRHSNESLQSTAFHVRFGKTKLLKPGGTSVQLLVNGILTSATMILGEAGEGYFYDDSCPCLNREASSSREMMVESPGSVDLSDFYSEMGSDIHVSLCASSLMGSDELREIDNKIFEDRLLKWSDLNDDPKLWFNAELVFRFGVDGPFVPSRVAFPVFASLCMTGRSISHKSCVELLKRKVVMNVYDEPGSLATALNEVSEFVGCCACETAGTVYADQERVKTFKPSSSVLNQLNLRPGVNTVEYVVDSGIFGRKTVMGSIYLWESHDKVIVSDVDGTITKSDIWGQIAPIVGRDWAHEGVAELFTLLTRRGYKILYMTARAIGQAGATRDYLFGLRQGRSDRLPDGPLFCSPDRLYTSFKREVIDKQPYLFKISALADIRNVFGDRASPIFAGFGNRYTDYLSYIEGGIPASRIFIIDPKGRVQRCSDNYVDAYGSAEIAANKLFPSLVDETSEVKEEQDVRFMKRLSFQKNRDKRNLSPDTCEG